MNKKPKRRNTWFQGPEYFRIQDIFVVARGMEIQAKEEPEKRDACFALANIAYFTLFQECFLDSEWVGLEYVEATDGKREFDLVRLYLNCGLGILSGRLLTSTLPRPHLGQVSAALAYECGNKTTRAKGLLGNRWAEPQQVFQKDKELEKSWEKFMVAIRNKISRTREGLMLHAADPAHLSSALDERLRWWYGPEYEKRCA